MFGPPRKPVLVIEAVYLSNLVVTCYAKTLISAQASFSYLFNAALNKDTLARSHGGTVDSNKAWSCASPCLAMNLVAQIAIIYIHKTQVCPVKGLFNSALCNQASLCIFDRSRIRKKFSAPAWTHPCRQSTSHKCAAEVPYRTLGWALAGFEISEQKLNNIVIDNTVLFFVWMHQCLKITQCNRFSHFGVEAFIVRFHSLTDSGQKFIVVAQFILPCSILSCSTCIARVQHAGSQSIMLNDPMHGMFPGQRSLLLQF